MCEPSILIVVVVARAGLFTVRQIREWATYVFIYLFIFTLRYVIAPFRYLSRPPISAALAPALLLHHITVAIHHRTAFPIIHCTDTAVRTDHAHT